LFGFCLAEAEAVIGLTALQWRRPLLRVQRTLLVNPADFDLPRDPRKRPAAFR
jgi:hypothetical protein